VRGGGWVLRPAWLQAPAAEFFPAGHSTGHEQPPPLEEEEAVRRRDMPRDPDDTPTSFTPPVRVPWEEGTLGQCLGRRRRRRPVEGSRASPPRRPREDGLAHPADA
jgi:hypothetical protein